jgi:hypothetical protein
MSIFVRYYIFRAGDLPLSPPAESPVWMRCRSLRDSFTGAFNFEVGAGFEEISFRLTHEYRVGLAFDLIMSPRSGDMEGQPLNGLHEHL